MDLSGLAMCGIEIKQGRKNLYVMSFAIGMVFLYNPIDYASEITKRD